jgi:ribosomal protein S18 acetylase RimI-like enzyme
MKPAAGGRRFTVETLGRQHDRRRFSCDCAPLEDYLRQNALQDQRKRIAVCHVLVASDEPTRVIGYYTLSSYTVRLTDLPPNESARLPRYPDVPVALLGRLAVDSAHRGRGCGELLLLDAMHRCFTRVASQMAIYALVTHAKSDMAAAFYRRYDFVSLPSAPLTLFLPMGTIARLYED